MDQDFEETWRPVTGFEGLYEVSNLGRVRSVDRMVSMRRVVGPSPINVFRRGGVLSPAPNQGGYPMVSLSKGGRGRSMLLHRLVATAFIGPCPEGLECAHLDGNRANARASNLKWVTHSENLAHCADHGTRTEGERSPHAKLTNSAVQEIRARYATGENREALAAKFGIKRRALYDAATGGSWRHVA